MTINKDLARIVVFAIGSAAAMCAAAQTQPATKPVPAATKPAPAAKAVQPARGEVKPVVEAKAMELLQAMSTRLASAKSMSFTATVGYEYPSRFGPPIVYTTRYDVTLQRPDRLRVVMPGDGPASEFIVDGKRMIAFAPTENLAAIADAPATIDAALQAAYKSASIYFPFTDLVLADPYTVFTGDLKLAFVVGPSGVVGGVKTDMVAWANNDVFLQIWIGADDKLPRRVRAMFRADRLGLRHEMELANWRIDPTLPADAFATAKAEAASRMAFAAPALPPGVRLVAGGKAKPAPATKQSAASTK